MSTWTRTVQLFVPVVDGATEAKEATVGLLSAMDFVTLDKLNKARPPDDGAEGAMRLNCEMLARRLRAFGDFASKDFANGAWLFSHLSLADLEMLLEQGGLLDSQVKDFREQLLGRAGVGAGAADGLEPHGAA